MTCDALRDDQWERLKVLCRAVERASAGPVQITVCFWTLFYG